jgi:hypothetical protein
MRTEFLKPSSTSTADQRFDRFVGNRRRDAGLAAGGCDDRAPGLRNYHTSYYAAFVRDPDGNRLEAVCHHPV